MKGFKSFANRTKIDFDNRITAIVGPNGSGKSNISDAVKRVLGEQSVKSLRGGKMKDVIFSGGEDVAPLNLAEVNLTFSNEDGSLDLPYDQVKIYRRIYRNGDNEYKINGKKVRLRDIRELFLDTGVGKEGYSVIGQGRIDSIINSSPKERRAIFEEASGISKHKYRRDESEKKLEKVTENLEIIDRDWEFKKRELKLAKEQKENFEKSQILIQDLNKKAYFYFKNKTIKLEEQIKKTDSLVSELERKREENQKTFDEISEKLAPFKDQISKLSKDFDSSKEGISRLEKDIDKKINLIKLTEQKLDYNQKDLSKSLADKKNNEEKIRNLIEKTKSREVELKENIGKIDQLKKESTKSKEEEISLKKENQELEKKIRQLKLEKSKLDEEIYEYDLNQKTKSILSKEKEERDRIKKEKISELSNKLQENSLQRQENEVKLENISKKLEALQKKFAFSQKEIEKIGIEKKDLHQRLNNNNISIKEELSNYKIYKNLLEKNEGYFYSVQEFLNKTKQSNLDQLYLDSLANLIRVKDGYEKVIDMLLSSSLQNIVTRTKDETKELINFVNRQRLGRITFLPIDSIYANRKNLPNEKEALAMAYDLIEYDKSISSIINHFLGSTVLVKDIDAAISLSKKIKGYRIISMDLDIINTWGSMVAGKNKSKNSNLGILNRSKKIEEIKKRVLFLKNQNQELEENLKNLGQKKANIDQEITSIDLEIKKKEELIIELKNFISHKDFEKKALDERIQELESSMEVESVEEKFENMDQIKEDAKKLAIDLEKSLNLLEKNKAELVENSKNIINLKNQLEIKIRDKTLLENKLEENNIELKNIIESERFSSKIKDSLEKEILENKENIENLNKKVSHAKEKLELLKEKIAENQRLIEEKNNENSLLVEKYKHLEKDLNELSLELVKVSYKKEGYEKEEKNIEDEVESFISKALKELEEDYKDLEIQKVVKSELIDLQKNINSVGYFSPQALEDYKKVFEDFKFLDEQKNDLEASKVDIEKLIKKLEDEMKDEFIKNFNIINQNFQTIFQKLFMGGKASLKLDDDDKLNAGIEISACPPGKSSKSLSLLSGGEKSLTAVALLFAIFETNPAPFSLLDEIDAALDETNIKRYIDYLKSLSDKTQFIMITHRQTTMQEAEKIHGVTIGDDGISKVYSIDFENKNQIK